MGASGGYLAVDVCGCAGFDHAAATVALSNILRTVGGPAGPVPYPFLGLGAGHVLAGTVAVLCPMMALVGQTRRLGHRRTRGGRTWARREDSARGLSFGSTGWQT